MASKGAPPAAAGPSGDAASAIASLAPRHVFGLKGDVKDNVVFIDENTIVYPAGHNIVFYNVEQKTQKFIAGSESSKGFTALAVSPNKKFLAVAERGDKPTITVYDVQTQRRRKQLSTSEVASGEFKSLCFSPDNKFLASLGGGPDWTLCYWTWEKSKLTAFAKASNAQSAPLYQVSFNPFDSGHMCVSGQGILKLYRYVDNTLKPSNFSMGKREPQTYLTHAWMNEERVIVATETGDLLLFDMGEFKTILSQSPSSTNPNHAVMSMVPYSKGFICAGEAGLLWMFERTDDKEMYVRTRSFKIDNFASNITSLAITPSEDTLVCSMENNQLFQLAMSSTDIYKSEDMKLEPLAQAFHESTVSGVDTCIRKPLVATCGMDKTVRIWNYMDRSVDLIGTFQEEAHSIAFHPSGLHVLVGFSDKLRLMNLLMDGIRQYREFNIKSCRECCFSNGGQYFAAVNGNSITIFNTYTCENIGNLRGHNGKVRSVFWSQDDQKIISAGWDGAVYEWSLADNKRKSESVLKGCYYNCCLCVPDGRAILAVGNDKKIKEIVDSTVNREYDTGVELTQLAMSQTGKMLFAGTSTGSLRSYKYPLNSEYQEFQCHSDSITRMKLSFDDSYLFTVSADGCLYMFDVRDRDKSSQAKEFVYAEEILVTKSDVEERSATMADLQNRVDELRMQNEYQLRLKDMMYSERIKELTDKYTAELEAEKSRYEVLLKEKSELDLEYDDRFKNQEDRHQDQLGNLEKQYSERLMAEMERYQALEKEKSDMNEKWDEQTMLLVEGHEKVIQELTEDYENKIQEDQMMIDRMREEKDEILKEFEETRVQIEEDADREIEDLKDKYETRLSGEREARLRLKGENGIMRKKFSALQKEIDDHKEEIKLQVERNTTLTNQISGLDKDIAGLRKEIQERDQTIGDKEKRIYDLKKKNQELEKFKFVLDYKIKELKRQIEPRELEIADMKDQIKEMDQELERYHKNNSNLELTINDMRLKTDGLQKELNLQRQKFNDTESLLKRFKTDLHECTQYIQDPKILKEQVKALYQRYVTNQVQAVGVDVDIQREYSRQREYLEKNLESLKKKLAKDSKLQKADNMRIMQENVALIKEINELRRELRQVRAENQTAKANMGRAQSERGRRVVTETQREVQMQRDEIARLRSRIDELETGHPPRPKSRERLPPMEGFVEDVQ